MYASLPHSRFGTDYCQELLAIRDTSIHTYAVSGEMRVVINRMPIFETQRGRHKHTGRY